MHPSRRCVDVIRYTATPTHALHVQKPAVPIPESVERVEIKVAPACVHLSCFHYSTELTLDFAVLR